MNDFKSLRIDTTLEDVHKESFTQLRQLVLDNVAKMENCGDDFVKHYRLWVNLFTNAIAF